MADELLAAIAADPDDDEARLVWADRVGGERGELVVLQCRLAKRLGTRAERIAMRHRERELLPLWGRPRPEDGLDDVYGLEQVTYGRGFVEGARLERRTLESTGAELFEAAPLLTELSLSEVYFGVNILVGPDTDEARDLDLAEIRRALARLPAGRLRRFQASAAQYASGDYTDAGSVEYYGDELVACLAASEACAQLVALDLRDGLLSLGSIAKLQGLPLRDLRASTVWGAAGCIELLRALPTLRRFAPVSSRLRGEELVYLLAAPEVAQLSALDLFGNQLGDEDLVRVAGSRMLAGVEALGLGSASWGAHGRAAICGSPMLSRLRDLDVYEYRTPTVAPFLHATAFTLDTVRLGQPEDAVVAELVGHPALEKVRVSRDQATLDALRAAIPDVQGR